MERYLLPVAVILAAIILAVAFRYTPTSSGTFDRWTGCYSSVGGSWLQRRTDPSPPPPTTKRVCP